MTNRTFSASEAAKLLSLNERTIRRAIERGQLPAQRVGRSFQIAEDDLAAYVASDEPGRETRFAGTELTRPVARRLVGREREIAALLELLRSDGTQLVSVVGTAGVGKTSVAIEALEALRADIGTGVVVELAQVTEADEVLLAIATTLGVQTGRRRPFDALVDAFSRRDGLLVLDNFEHVLPAAAMVRDLKTALPEWVFLLTSRTALGVPEEQTFPLAPLPVPPQGVANSELRTASPAVRLFVQQLQKRQPHFSLTGENAATVAEIVRRLDGLPLAIELAVPIAERFSPVGLLERIDQRFPILIGGARAAPARHRTLRDAIAWSFDLLTADERQALVRLSLPPAGFTLELAEALLSPETTRSPGVGSPTHAVVESLVGKSLVVPQLSGRFRILESIREFAATIPEAAEAMRRAQQALATFVLEIATQYEREQFRSGQVRMQAQVFEEIDNIRASLKWATESGNAEIAQRICGHLALFWSNAGLMQEGLEQTGRALELNGQVDSGFRVSSILAAGWLAYRLGNLDAAESYAREAIDLVQGSDPAKASRGATLLGLIVHSRGDHPAARAWQEQAIILATEAGQSGLVARAMNNLGLITLEQGQLDEAEAFLQQSEEIERRNGNTRGLAVVLTNLGQVYGWRGDMERAAQYFEESINLLRHLGERHAIYTVILNLGAVQAHVGNLEEASLLTAEAVEGFRETGDRDSAPIAMFNLAAARNRQGEYQEALSLLGDAATMTADVGNVIQLAEIFEEAGRTLIRAGLVDQGVRTFGAAARIREETSAGPDPNNEAEQRRLIGMARETLGHERYARLFMAGRASSNEHVVASIVQIQIPEDAGSSAEDRRNTPRLSSRELDVLALLAEGLTDQQIADQLFLSKRTVSSHVASILGKLNVDSRTAAASVAIRLNLI